MTEKRRRILIAGCLIAFSLIVILPPVVHGYVYPNLGDDSGYHLMMIKADNLWDYYYFGQVIIGYPIQWVADITGISVNQLFLWFNFLALVAVGFSFYFVLARLVNYKAGLFALALPIFLSRGILSQWDFGMICNVISSGIIFPWLVYSAIMWVKGRKPYQMIAPLALVLLFSVFHAGGIYLVPIASAVLAIVVGYRLVFKSKNIDYSLFIFIAAIMAVGIIGQYLLVNPDRFVITNKVLVGNEILRTGYLVSVGVVLGFFVLLSLDYARRRLRSGILVFASSWKAIVFLVVTVINIAFAYLIVKEQSYYVVIGLTRGEYSGGGNFLPFAYAVMVVCPATMIIAILSLWLVDRQKIKSASVEIKSLILILMVFVTIVGGITFAGLTKTPDRTLFDMVTPFALLASVFAALAWDWASDKVVFVEMSRKLIIRCVVIGFIVAGLYVNLPGWVGYRSTVREADKEAIAYLNTLPYETYVCSTEIAPLIYNQFAKQEYDAESEELLVTRNIPMTPGSDKESRAYFGYGIETTDGFELDRIFSADGVEVSIWLGEK